MIDLHEPRNGDFVAYLEQLQRESAARLARPSTPMALPSSSASGAPPPRVVSAAESFANRSEPATGAVPVEQVVARLAASRAGSRAVGAAITLLIGAVLFFVWLFDTRSGFLFVAAIALSIWGFSRLRAALAELSGTERQVGREVIVRWLNAGKRR